MKKPFIALVVLALILTAGILENAYVSKVFDELDNRLDELSNQIQSKNESALDTTVVLFVWWEKKREVMELFTFSSDLRAMSVAIAEMQGSLEQNDYDNAFSKCRSLFSISKNLRRILDFNVEDII